METKTFSPKELAEILGVSESSIKRWADDGLIEVTRTAGGHRRILLNEAMRFARKQEMRILRPDLLGLPDLADLPPEAYTGELTEEVLFALLQADNIHQARGAIAAAYLNGMSLPDLFDGPVAGALDRFGALWLDDDRGVFLEHVATNICVEALNLIRLLIPTPQNGAPVALGGAPEGDPYQLPTLMVATILTDLGYYTVNVGANTPISAFQHAVAAHHPSLVWIAATSELTEETRTALVEELARPLHEQQSVEVIVGGRDTELHAGAWPDTVRVLPSMSELVAFVRDHRNGMA